MIQSDLTENIKLDQANLWIYNYIMTNCKKQINRQVGKKTSNLHKMNIINLQSNK